MRSVVVAVAVLAACGSLPKTERVERSSTVASSFEATWQALIDLVATRGWPIGTLDKSSGLFTTGEIRFPPEYLDCGDAGLAEIVATRGRLAVQLRNVDGGVQIKPTVTATQYQSVAGSIRTVQCVSRGQAESIVIDSLASTSASADRR